MVSFSARVIRWHKNAGRHDLPWQKNPTAYRVWVSEVMLQQTQVATVIPYYQRFMRRFPSLKQLALAPEDEVLSYWSGLGYYARARHLHKTAGIVHARHHGRFPRTVDDLSELPGIGRSTAGAICSLAYQQHAVILDGNVKRVLARHAMIAGWPGNKAVHDALWDHASTLTPRNNAATYNQAMMDIGSSLCTRSKPNCPACPVADDCQARLAQQQHAFPGKKNPPSTRRKDKAVFFLIRAKNKPTSYFLTKRPTTGIWGGLWCFPQYPTLEAGLNELQNEFSALTLIKKKTGFLHVFSHFDLFIEPIILECEHERIPNHNTAWVDIHHLSALSYPGGVPAPVEKIIHSLTLGDYNDSSSRQLQKTE